MLKLAGEFIEGQLADHEADLDPHLVETLPVLLKGGNLLHIPTNAGWTETVVGSGATAQQVTRLYVNTGGTANSKGQLHSTFTGFQIGSNFNLFDWEKKLYVVFNYSRGGNDIEAVARFQIKETNAEGALTTKGIGLRVDNFALKGESYGTSLGVIDLGVSLAPNEGVQIVILHYPASKIEWYVNGVLKGTQSTTANIPSGQAGVESQIVFSFINGATGGANVFSQLLHPKIWQEI